MGIFKIPKNKASRSILRISMITKIAKICHFRENFNFYPNLDFYVIRTRRNFENPNSKSLDPRLIMLIMLKELFLGSTNFTVSNFKLPQISKQVFGYAK